MPFITITKPNVGDPTKKQSFADLVIDNLIFLWNQFLSLVGSREIIVNGSFESDADGDGIPDGWTRTLFTGGSFSHEQSTAIGDLKSFHGARAIKFTSPGGAGNGGGYVDTTDFVECSENRAYWLSWQSKSSVAGVRNKVDVTFYDSTKTLISTQNIFDSTTNPAAWTIQTAGFKPVANTRFVKFRFTGADNTNTTAGDVWFDNIQILTLVFNNSIAVNVPCAGHTWTPPFGVYLVVVLI